MDDLKRAASSEGRRRKADQGGRLQTGGLVLDMAESIVNTIVAAPRYWFAASSWSDQSRFCPGQPKQEFGSQKVLAGFPEFSTHGNKAQLCWRTTT